MEEDNLLNQGLEITGTQFDDPNIIGTELGEEILAQRGDDSVTAGLGDDVIFGGPGNDTISGDDGNDRIFGNSEDDLIFGDSSNPNNEASGSDTIRGQEGNDSIFGGNADDVLISGLGNDFISGDAGNDRLVGEDNDDTIIGGSGSDTLFGGSGSDTLIGVDTTSSNTNYGRNTIDIINGEADSDTFVLGQEINGENVVFYDSNSNSLGTDDYALITDFEIGEDGDTLELIGSRDDYSFAASPADLPSGVGVFSEQESGRELIAILEGISESNIGDINTTLDPVESAVEFGNIIQTPTVFPEQQGQIELTVTSQEDTSATINLYASTDSDLDNGEELNTLTDTIEGTNIDALEGTDELLGTINGINLSAGEESTFTIDFASEQFDTASVVSPGGYNLIAEVDFGNDLDNELATQFISSDNTDVVLDWNSTFLNAVQAEGKAELGSGGIPQEANTLDAIPGVAPPVVARNAAILHLAVYDAVNALSDNSLSSYLGEALPNVPQGASQEAAAVGAGYTVLTELFPEQQATFNAQRDRSLGEISDDAAAEEAGFDFGVEVAQAVLQDRSDDGAEQAQVPFIPGDFPLYQEETENGQVTALLPNWGQVEPFAIDSVEEFNPDNLPPEDILGLPELDSDEYADQVNEVGEVGALIEDTQGNPVSRTEDQTEIAQFWSYDRPDTFRPPGQWNEIAQEAVLSQDDINSLEDNALLFAQLNIAMADAGIVTWDVKYDDELLRPVTALNREESNQINPNINVDPDGDWQPLIDTPNFPDYISGHSAFGGAAAGVLEDFLGNDVVLELPSQELPGITRTFTGIGELSSFQQAAFENADSRLFGGVHIDASNQDGVAVGLAVADNILNEGNLFV